ncbi:ATP-binding cassette domain-containing protein [Streptomyces sp. WMMC905]|uniref:ATP-binding cassette domain-containing protein n=1 Tax=Streptomyces sp. WMMC905 TaxID=3404123 RepID=UPI003B9477C0
MIQAFGLTSAPRRGLPLALDDVSFEASGGRVTTLLGTPGSGKTTALRLMLGLQRGRGVTYFRGRPLHRIAYPAREVGVLLGDVRGNPGRTLRDHLAMVCAAAGVQVGRADEVLETLGLSEMRGERLGTLSPGMERRFGLAVALSTDPHTLVLDDPTGRLAGVDSRPMLDTVRAYASQGGTVLWATTDAEVAARIADRVVTLDKGRVVADQGVGEFARTRLRPRVVVRSPQAARLAAVLARQARAERRPVEVVPDGGNRLTVFGGSCAEIGEAAFRSGIPVHRLADETGDMGAPGDGGAPGLDHAAGDRPYEASPVASAMSPVAGGTVPAALGGGRMRRVEDTPDEPTSDRDPGRPPGEAALLPAPPGDTSPHRGASGPTSASSASGRTGARPGRAGLGPAPRVGTHGSRARTVPGPQRPFRYELRRATHLATAVRVGAVVVCASMVSAAVLAHVGHAPPARVLAAWPGAFPLPPAALGAALLGALASGEEFRYPVLTLDRCAVPRRFGLLAAKLLLVGAMAAVLAAVVVLADVAALLLVPGRSASEVPADWAAQVGGWVGLIVGCSWLGVLGAGLFRSTAAGLAAAVAVPVVVAPLLGRLRDGVPVTAAAGPPVRAGEAVSPGWLSEGWPSWAAFSRLVGQPLDSAVVLSLLVLLGGCLLIWLRGRAR